MRFEDIISLRREIFLTPAQKLLEYLKTEHLTKRGMPLDHIKWKSVEPSVLILQFGPRRNLITLAQDTPKQDNPFDCGVFACQFMRSLAAGETFWFAQQDVPSLRRMMISEIEASKMVPDPKSDSFRWSFAV